jgi:hypothetical protein
MVAPLEPDPEASAGLGEGMSFPWEWNPDGDPDADADPRTYSDWLDYVFRPESSEWRLEIGDGWQPPLCVCVEYLTRLFRESQELLRDFLEEQLAKGLDHISGRIYSDYVAALFWSEIAWEKRREAIRSIPLVFERLFAVRCTETLSHVGEPGNPLNCVCYMWWDGFSYYGRPSDSNYATEDAECLAAMKQVLSLPSIACQESALHGLGHWQRQYPAVVGEAIDEYLASNPGLRPRLRTYAETRKREMSYS